ncbi:MAG: peptidoglycan bridge formation glycyltransferase FemA/FemB family protein [bacterium]
MERREVTDEKYRREWNKLALHPLQTWEWGGFRATTGVRVVRYGIFNNNKLIEPITITIHRIPHTPWTIGYLPKGNKPTRELMKVLDEVSKKNKCIYIKLEPKVEKGNEWKKLGLVEGKPLFTKYNFVLNATKSEEELLKQMKQKTRYNIRVAEKNGVEVGIDNSNEAFEEYLHLTKETTERQGFYAHSEKYHRQMWEMLGKNKTKDGMLTAELMVAKYQGKIITTWVLFTLNDTLYYPYGASSRDHREVMANNLVMWEVIRLAKARGLKYLDMWGALGPEPDKNDPWYGFHKFKEGYGGRLVEYAGTWDYVARPLLYYPLRVIELLRWKILRAVK